MHDRWYGHWGKSGPQVALEGVGVRPPPVDPDHRQRHLVLPRLAARSGRAVGGGVHDPRVTEGGPFDDHGRDELPPATNHIVFAAPEGVVTVSDVGQHVAGVEPPVAGDAATVRLLVVT